jgi:signal transduction histidine kinase
MVNELLDEAQVEANKVVLHRIMFSPGGLLQQIHSILSGAAHSKGLELFSTLDPNLQGEMYGDERRIRQIMTNLVANAIKFTKHGSIHVKVFSPDPEHWSIQVTDTGIGISKEHLQSIFEPFQQGDNAVTGDNRGIGLGLSITRQLVDLMNGRILVDSQVGKGTTFSVLLPIEKGSLWVSSDIGIQI